MARLFVAVWPPADVVGVLRSLPRHAQPRVRWTPQSNWHVTLRFLGEADPDEVRSRLDAATIGTATATIGPTVRRLGRDLVVVPVDGLDGLVGDVVDATRDVGMPPTRRRFAGHITLARLRRGGRCDLIGSSVHAVFEVAEVTLVRSVLGRDGATYHVVARWPVGGHRSPPAT